MIDKLDGIRVLPSGHGLLSLLVGNERLSLIDIITLTVGETQMVTLIGLSPSGRKQVRDDQVEQLRHVDDIEELCAVADIEPHPVSVGLQTDGLESQQLEEVGSK